MNHPRTGGWKVEAMNELGIHDWALLYLIRLGHKNLNLVYAGGYDGCFGFLGALDYGITYVEAGGDCMMGPIGGQGGGGTCLWENFTCFDPHDKTSVEGTLEFFDACTELGLKRGWGVGMEKWNAAARGPDGRTPPKKSATAFTWPRRSPPFFAIRTGSRRL